MKTLRRICAGMILSLTFAVPAVAGDIHCPGVVSTGTSPTTATIVVTIVSVVY